MAEEIKGMKIKISVDNSDVDRGVDAASSKLGALKSKIADTSKTLAKYGVAAGVAGAAITTALVVKSLKAIDAQAKMARQLDTTSKSMATLQRAGELGGVSMGQISIAAKTLAVRIGEAEQGVVSSVDAFKILKIEASDLAGVPLDKRISLINNALRENVPATQQAAIAADLFGQRAATAIKLLDDPTIERARKETELFGLALSDIEAGKIEAANDSMSRIGKGVEGLGQQLTVKLAPALEGIGDEFADVIEEMGGMEKVAEQVFGGAVDGVGTVLDAVHQLDVGWEVMKNGAIIAFAEIGQEFNGLLATLEEHSFLFRQLTDFDSEGAKKDIVLLKDVVDSAAKAIEDKLAEPVPSEGLKKWVADTQAAADEVKEIMSGGDDAEGKVTRLFSPEEEEAIAKKLEAIREAALSEGDILREKTAAEQEILQQGLDAKLLTQTEYNSQLEDLQTSSAANLLKIQQDAANKDKALDLAARKQKIAAAKQTFGQISGLMSSESRKLFELGKAAAIANATISGIEAAVHSFKFGAQIGGPYVGAAFAAASLLSTGAQIQQISSQSFGGGATATATAPSIGGSAAVNTQGAGQSASGAVSGGGSQDRNTFVQGIDPNQFFSGAQMIELINDAQEDGSTLRIAN